MKILMIHNYYQQPGGEDNSFVADVDLLRQHGHEVLTYVRTNDELHTISSLRIALKTIWNYECYKDIKKIIRKFCPDVVHCQNTFILISPAAYYAAKAQSVPVVQTLHNFRLACPGGLFFRDGKICEDCLGKLIPFPGVLHSCYRRSKAATCVVAAKLLIHRMLGTWSKIIDKYIILTDFSRQKFIQAGFPKDKLMVKPNFVKDEELDLKSNIELRNHESYTKPYALFVGRLSPEKGIDILLKAWEMAEVKVELRVVGDGPLAYLVEKAALKNQNIIWMGQKSIYKVYALMAGAKFLIFPSKCYEGMPRTIIEAFAHGTPVLSSNIGSMTEMISQSRTGLHFEPGNVKDLAKKIKWAFEYPEEMSSMGQAARKEYEAKYTPEMNYNILMNIYQQAIDNHQAKYHAKSPI